MLPPLTLDTRPIFRAHLNDLFAARGLPAPSDDDAQRGLSACGPYAHAVAAFLLDGRQPTPRGPVSNMAFNGRGMTHPESTLNHRQQFGRI